MVGGLHRLSGKPREAVLDDLLLDRELQLVAGVRQDAAAAWVWFADPVLRGLDDALRTRKARPLAAPLDSRHDEFARERAGHEHDRSVGAGQHAAAGDRFLDSKRQGLRRGLAHALISGSPCSSRMRRRTTARRAWR